MVVEGTVCTLAWVLAVMDALQKEKVATSAILHYLRNKHVKRSYLILSL